jgi:hypothetical protein
VPPTGFVPAIVDALGQMLEAGPDPGAQLVGEGRDRAQGGEQGERVEVHRAGFVVHIPFIRLWGRMHFRIGRA